jgi:hypothetical protein
MPAVDQITLASQKFVRSKERADEEDYELPGPPLTPV